MYRDQQEVRINRIHSCVQQVLEFIEVQSLVLHPGRFVHLFRTTIRSAQTCYGGVTKGIPFVKLSTRNEYHDPVKYAGIMLRPNPPVYGHKHYNLRMVAAAKLGTGAYIEYASFDKDPEIGGFYSDSADLCTMAVVCHEIAHAAVSWNTRYCVYLKNGITKVKPHGPEWKQMYKILRRKFVNPYLPRNHVEVHQTVLDRVQQAAKRIPRKRKN